MFNMMTIIAGTNRIGSNTKKIALAYQHLLNNKGIKADFLSLEDINLSGRNETFLEVEKGVLTPTSAFIIIAPEYNGSFPGVLKTFIDISKVDSVWRNKKALLVGVATGRAGNLRGMDHLTGVLNHIGVTVHPNKLPISRVDTLLDERGHIKDPATISTINRQLDEFLEWCHIDQGCASL